uniref:DNA polymerase n=1 Tax=uncultured marine virus TaxID=186617 RepID=A0A0F7LCE5_9VIRU|nr:DNA polymerase [uncultured marine virus]
MHKYLPLMNIEPCSLQEMAAFRLALTHQAWSFVVSVTTSQLSMAASSLKKLSKVTSTLH